MAFWTRKSQTVIELSAPEPVAVTSQSEDELSTYEAAVLAAGGGADSPFLLEAKLARAMAENGLSAFDYQKVSEYLIAKFPNGWAWLPFSSLDTSESQGSERLNPQSVQQYGRWWNSNGWIVTGQQVYAKPVPLPVLNTIAILRTAIPQAKFFISDELRPEYGDPFLMVKIPGSETCHVIERWDEPSFRG